MKKLYILLVALFLVNGAMAQWVPQNSGTTNNLYSVCFPNMNTGYAVGDSGIILKTTNGGTEWTAQAPGNYDSFSSVFFIDADTGYAVGRGNLGTAYILKTSNSGTNWQIVFSYKEFIGSWLTSVHFPVASTGYALGYSSYQTGGTAPFIAKTTNCGWNWTVMDLPAGMHGTSIHFTSTDTGFIAGGNFMDWLIMKTTNGGNSWTSTSSGLPWHRGGLSSVFFSDPENGYAVGSTFLKTNDGGTSWTDLDNASGNSVFFTNTGTGYIVGQAGKILKTTDGGTTWFSLNSGISSHLQEVHFTDAETGYAVGQGGTILKTTNGGGPATGTFEKPSQSAMINICPTITTETITIKSENPGALSIHGLNGHQLLYLEITEPTTTIDVSGLKSGVYVVKVFGEKGVQVGKFIKE